MQKEFPTLQDIVSGGMDPETVLAIRRCIYADDGAISQEEMARLFTISAAVGDVSCREWSQLFCDALADLMLNQAEPAGYISDAQANWFFAQVTAQNRHPTTVEFEALLYIMERARFVPSQLSNFALQEIKHEIAHGAVTKLQVEKLRRLLFAMNSEGHSFISRVEAEFLFEIAEATAGADNDPAFDDLFIRAIANHMLATSGHVAPAETEALHRRRWLDEEVSVDIGGFFRKALTGLASGESFARQEDEFALKNLAEEAALLDSEKITQAESDWIAERMNRDGKISNAEKKLLCFLKSEASEIDPSLQAPLSKII